MKIQKLFTHELWWCILVASVLLFLSYGPIIQNYLTAPPDKFYFGQLEYPIDMLGDLAYVQQGYQGNLLASFNYSTMIGGHPSILKMEYTIVGLLGQLLNLSPIVMFMVSRFAISLLLLMVIYFLIRQVFTELWQRIVSYIFVLFGTGMSVPGVLNRIVTSGMYDAQVFQRLTQAMPHYVLGAGSVLLSLFFLSRTLEKPQRTGGFLLSLLFGIAASLLYAINSVLLISGFPLYIVFDSISVYLRTKRVRIDMEKVGILFAYAVVTLAPVAYVHHVTTSMWNDIRTARLEQLNPFRVTTTEYVVAVGVLYLLAIFSIPAVIRKGKPILMVLATWLVMHPVGEFIISPILHINAIRYFLTPYYVAFGILATSGVIILSDWFKKRMRNIPQWIITSVLSIALFSTSIGTYTTVWKGEHVCFCFEQFFDYAYPKKTVMDGIFWLQRNTKPSDVVLSGYYAGTLIAAFSGNHPYVTWWYRLIEPPTIQNTERSLAAFYSGSMPEKYALTFLTQQRISYVFYSEQEQLFAKGKQTLEYSFLTVRYNTGGTLIYQVK